jgi:hypothetical protein
MPGRGCCCAIRCLVYCTWLMVDAGRSVWGGRAGGDRSSGGTMGPSRLRSSCAPDLLVFGARTFQLRLGRSAVRGLRSKRSHASDAVGHTRACRVERRTGFRVEQVPCHGEHSDAQPQNVLWSHDVPHLVSMDLGRCKAWLNGRQCYRKKSRPCDQSAACRLVHESMCRTAAGAASRSPGDLILDVRVV